MNDKSADEDPMGRLLADLGRRHVAGGHLDRIYDADGRPHDITPSKFIEIKTQDDSGQPGRMAFVDGGNGTIYEAPGCLVVLNRVYYAVFRGDRRLKTQNVRQTTTFLSCSMAGDAGRGANGNGGDNNNGGSAGPAREKLSFDTTLYSYEDDPRTSDYLPPEDDLRSHDVVDGANGQLRDAVPPDSRARSLAELKLAAKVVSDELASGDMIVMDGSLQTSVGASQRYAERLYDTAMQKGVTVCGISKTSRLLTESGEPLTARVHEMSGEVPHGIWYVPIARRIYNDSRGFTLAAKLHPNSRFVFRVDILDEQYHDMSGDQRNSVLASLAGNSNYVAILGYPYGAVDADTHAQVSNNEARMCRRLLDSKLHGNPRLRAAMSRRAASVIFHDVLNRVTG